MNASLRTNIYNQNVLTTAKGYIIMQKQLGVHMKYLGILAIVTLSACSSHVPPYVIGDQQCSTIGCGQDLVMYPNEEFAAQEQSTRLWDWDWGSTSSAYHPSDPQHQKLKEQEILRGQTPWHWNIGAHQK